MYLWTKQDKATHSYLLEPEVSKKIWNMARMLSGMRKDVYFSLGTTADPLPADLRAKQQNVTSIACLWVDIDIVDSAAHKAGNLPKSVDEAMGLLPEKYPPSIIVSSGHGLHAYWLLKEPVIINDENRRKSLILSASSSKSYGIMRWPTAGKLTRRLIYHVSSGCLIRGILRILKIRCFAK